ncbi:MAG: DUF2807 domain-containing protein [Saprospiraceae bacterium]
MEGEASPDDLNITLQGNRLKLSMVDGWVKNDGRLRIRLQYNQLSHIRVLAGAVLESRAVLTADHLEIKGGSGAEVTLEIAAKTLEGAAVEGARVMLNGTVDMQYASAATGGLYDAARLLGAHTDVKANTGGEAHVYASEYLDAAANTGGRIRYDGDPEKRFTKTNLAGEIRGF